MEKKLTKKELLEEMFPQAKTKSHGKLSEVDVEQETTNILDEIEMGEYDDGGVDDLKEARERIYGTSQATEMKRLHRLFNKLNN